MLMAKILLMFRSLSLGNNNLYTHVHILLHFFIVVGFV